MFVSKNFSVSDYLLKKAIFVSVKYFYDKFLWFREAKEIKDAEGKKE